jgi:hypothetical protein
MDATRLSTVNRTIKSVANLVLLVAIALAIGECAFSVAPTSSKDKALTIDLAAFPDRLSVEDSTAVAEIWATVREGTRPVQDSTVVVFATTVGTITSSTITLDGLAIALLQSPGDGRSRRGEIVAQVRTVRDTLDVDFTLTTD